MDGEEPPILRLPTEILLEVTAYYQYDPLPYQSERYPQMVKTSTVLFGRWGILRALSQTCRKFRHIFISLVWERLEALDEPSSCTGRHIDTLMRRITGILKTPSLPRCVRTLVISLKLASENNRNLIAVLGRFLRATPNLTALHIIDISTSNFSSLATLFQWDSFPSVQILTIPCTLSHILSSFPNLRSLIAVDTVPHSQRTIQMLKTASKHSLSLESLVDFPSTPAVVEYIVEHIPRVKSIIFRQVASPDIVTLLGTLENLRFVQFPYRYQPPSEIPEDTCKAIQGIFGTSRGSETIPISVLYSDLEANYGELVITVCLTRP
ncbi:hypothetical protein C8J57DRAFT_607356 [Mycena rebaudengoi]|nr:hypothetical protein C8J57DRAFT_607356 [Mycena rebaudengoi]